MSRPRTPVRRLAPLVAASVLLAAGSAGASAAAGAAPSGRSGGPAAINPTGGPLLVRLQLRDRSALDRLAARGVDIAARPAAGPDDTRHSGAVLVDVVVTPTQLAALQDEGAVVRQVIAREGDGHRHLTQSRAAARRARQTGRTRSTDGVAAVDTLHFVQSYWWTTNGRAFVQAEVASTAVTDPDVEITLTWTTADGRTGTVPLQRFEDAGEYQYHYTAPVALPAAPLTLTATSSLGGTARRDPKPWPNATPPPAPAGYQHDFISAYMTPVDVQARIKRLARQHPDLVDVVNLPHRTQGYRRTAVAYVGDPATAAIAVESKRFGVQGMNGVQVTTVDPGAPSRPLGATYRDRVLTVRLATDATAAVISTTDQVAALVSARYPLQFSAFVENGSTGKVMPVVAPARLDDGLGGPVNSNPWTVQALRIGKHRDGSRPAVLTYSQEHAREWATPLVTLELAERLLANARTDPATAALLEAVEVFVVPVTNPDGANYSFNDFAFQRKNLDNVCTGPARDPANRNRWGVDVNRNYAVGSVFDGYVGGSLDCLSSVAAGTAELSEPESRNIVDLARAHPNIRYAMNVHSYGGYFMWPPGAYAMPGRVTLPRPSAEESAAFTAAARRIVGAIAQDRGTLTWPSQTGPVADVLYSAAGNSADQLYYELGVYAWDFEVGNDVWDEATSSWQGVGFQPPYAEAHAESQEYAAGLLELVRVASETPAGRR